MLQFLTHKSGKYSIAEEAQMAIEGGCTWIQITDSMNPGDTMKELVKELQPLCEENQAFLVIDSDVELCNEMRVHGVHLHKGDMAPAAAREALGPHAVIGVDVETADDILALEGLDIDYAVLGPFEAGHLLIEDYSRIISEARSKGSVIPIVARGQIAVEDLVLLLGTGVNGFAVSKAIIEAADPVTAVKEMLKVLNVKPSDINTDC